MDEKKNNIKNEYKKRSEEWIGNMYKNELNLSGKDNKNSFSNQQQHQHEKESLSRMYHKENIEKYRINRVLSIKPNFVAFPVEFIIKLDEIMENIIWWISSMQKIVFITFDLFYRR